MKEQPRTYTDREINHFLGDIKETLKRQNEVLERIEAQTTKTNGRVTQSEKDIAELKWWKSSIIWGWGVLFAIVLFLANKYL
jgi:hypothetical protein